MVSDDIRRDMITITHRLLSLPLSIGPAVDRGRPHGRVDLQIFFESDGRLVIYKAE
jgi:hypothetical protein